MSEAQGIDVMVYVGDVEACRRHWTQKLGFVETGTRLGPGGSAAYELSFGMADARVVLMDRAPVDGPRQIIDPILAPRWPGVERVLG
ncbi:MAG: hypothetical protein PUD09_08850 [Coriobacteriales bacterium]|nr:hypothetical protein [Coriobacteriales bacterium]